MTKFMPHPEVNRIIKKRSSELRKFKCYSTWYYDEEKRKIVICTTRPGLWIGIYGIDVRELTRDINLVLFQHKKDPITISFIECES